jgi:hypothetical protein
MAAFAHAKEITGLSRPEVCADNLAFTVALNHKDVECQAV